MKIPQDFKEAIKKAFYDKQLEVYDITYTKDDEGFSSFTTTKVKDILGNVQYTKLDEVKREYGLDRDLAFILTTQDEVMAGQLVKYNNTLYEIVRVLPRDSHYYILVSSFRRNE